MPSRDLAVAIQVGGGEQHGHERDRLRQRDHREEPDVHERGAPPGADLRVAARLVGVDRLPLAPERLDHAHAREPLLQRGQRLGDPVADRVVGAARAVVEGPARGDQHRQRDQRDEREHRARGSRARPPSARSAGRCRPPRPSPRAGTRRAPARPRSAARRARRSAPARRTRAAAPAASRRRPRAAGSRKRSLAVAASSVCARTTSGFSAASTSSATAATFSGCRSCLTIPLSTA